MSLLQFVCTRVGVAGVNQKRQDWKVAHTIIVAKRDGSFKSARGEVGTTVKDCIKNAGIDELEAQCGGNCSCATCHVYVEEIFFERISKMSSSENELLDSVEHRRSNSRLACQILFSQDLSGMRVELAPVDDI